MSCKDSPASRSEKIHIYSDITCRNAFTFISARSFSMIFLIVQSGELTYDASMFAGRLTADTHLSTFSRASKILICIDSTCKSAFHRYETKSIMPVSTSMRLMIHVTSTLIRHCFHHQVYRCLLYLNKIVFNISNYTFMRDNVRCQRFCRYEIDRAADTHLPPLLSPLISL